MSDDIFAGHLLPVEAGAPLLRHYTAELWPSVLLFAGLTLIAMVRVRWFPRLAKILQSTFSRQLQQQLEREEIDPFRFYWVALNLLLLLNLAFVCWKLNSLGGFVFQGTASLLQFLLFFAIITAVFVLKYVANSVIRSLTGRKDIIVSYAINSALVNQTLGIAIFPFSILMQFGPFDPRVFLYAALALLGAGMLIKWYRGIRKALLEERIGIMQIFSYFCALEILPVLVLVKYLVVTF